MQYEVSYQGGFLGETYLGKGSKKPIVIHAEVQKPTSQLWFCTICGDSYLRIKIESSNYIAVRNECEKCGKTKPLLYKTRITLSGSILMEGFNSIDELSEEMLRRELLLEINAAKFLKTLEIV